MITEDMLKQDFLVDEVEKLKNEAEVLRHALEKRIQQQEKRESSGMADMEGFTKVLESQFEKLSEQLEEMEVAIAESQEKSKKDTAELVAETGKNVSAKLSEMDETLTAKMEEIQKNYNYIKMALSEERELIDFMEQKLDEKASQDSMKSLHRRITAVLMVSIVGLGGTIMTLALLCYLIMNMAR